MLIMSCYVILCYHYTILCVCFVVADTPACTLESLQQSKLYQREQRRQFKELKELVRRHQKKTSELLREFSNKYKKLARQCSKSRFCCLINSLQN